MDWTGCEIVEVIPGKVSGVPLVVGTRIPADTIFDYIDSDSSLEEMTNDYPSLSMDIIRRLASFVTLHRMSPVS